MLQTRLCPTAGLLAVLLAAVHPGPARAQSSRTPFEQVTCDILRELVEIPSTESGVGSTPAARAIEKRLLAAGFPREDVQVVGPGARKMNLVARLRGRGQRPADPAALAPRRGRGEGRGLVARPAAVPVRRARRLLLRARHAGHQGRCRDPDREPDPLEAGGLGARPRPRSWRSPPTRRAAPTTASTGCSSNRRELIDAEYCLNTDSGDFQSKAGVPFLVAVAAAEKKATAHAARDHEPRRPRVAAPP